MPVYLQFEESQHHRLDFDATTGLLGQIMCLTCSARQEAVPPQWSHPSVARRFQETSFPSDLMVQYAAPRPRDRRRQE